MKHQIFESTHLSEDGNNVMLVLYVGEEKVISMDGFTEIKTPFWTEVKNRLVAAFGWVK